MQWGSGPTAPEEEGHIEFSLASGGCLFDEPYSTCGYSQAEDDDFNWEQVNTLTKPTSDPWMPSEVPSKFSEGRETFGPRNTSKNSASRLAGRVGG
ncbi:hypothetical protein CB1_000932026 [Camelus ferus]|nr:hypothetical protein CB1_000932026 [Camelus ferus]